jgi:hypothetical protein
MNAAIDAFRVLAQELLRRGWDHVEFALHFLAVELGLDAVHLAIVEARNFLRRLLFCRCFDDRGLRIERSDFLQQGLIVEHMIRLMRQEKGFQGSTADLRVRGKFGEAADDSAGSRCEQLIFGEAVEGVDDDGFPFEGPEFHVIEL